MRLRARRAITAEASGARKPRPSLEIAWYALLSVVAAVSLAAGVISTAAVSPEFCSLCHAGDTEALAQTAHADLPCDACHAASEPFRLAESRLRVVGMVAMAPFTDESAGIGRVENDACTACHGQDIAGLVTAGGIRMDHRAPTQEGWSCVFCHGATGHADRSPVNARYTMDSCLGCHSSSPENIVGCSICHDESGPDRDRTAVTPWRVTHGGSWRQTHGMGDLDTCGACHNDQYCVACHSLPLPHGERFLADHGETVAALGSRESCVQCHTPARCEGCHGVEMPHPGGYLQAHSTLIQAGGDDVCARCHEPSSCEECHTRHVHPGLTDEVVRALRGRPVR